MAIIGVLLGGIIGFTSFLISLLAFDASFASACAVYMVSGCATAALVIIIAMIPDRAQEPKGHVA
ncbi:hypothetical protein [Sulfitobacter sp. SK011]|jgi:uncharacterized membrane protein YuzA (DUF378 family)|uniref:hypothetical protein n=1 Tax=Sulfitobacter sp. SK011 TaxID=1389004 RepID=UPI000E0ABD0D|nr:hypothetical protein [Sulfitobacter sp. SK011]AXI43450.1 hypothetical protein C1J02_17075 [Sulfitobacter sp. SK011]